MSLTYGEMFAGYNGLGMGVQSVLGGEMSWCAELDAAPSKILAHHWPTVVNLGDVTKVDWSTVPRVDVLTGGFPCTDVSHAGKRAGMRPGTRSGLWSHMAYAVEQLRPRLVVIENVRGLLSATAVGDVEPCAWCVGDGEGSPMRALGCVLADLASLGYDARWYGLRAADVGAPHGRFRIFVFAHPTGDPWRFGNGDDGAAVDAASQRGRALWTDQGRSQRADGVGRGGQWSRVAADADGLGHERAGVARGRRAGPANDGLTAADARSISGDEEQVGRTGPGAKTPGGQTGGTGGHRLLRASADPTGDGWDEGRLEPARLIRGSHAAQRSDAPPANAAQPERRGPQPEHLGTSVGSTPEPRERTGTPTDWGQYAPAINRWSAVLGRPAPAPTEPGPKGGPRLSARFVEWMQGLDEGHVTDVPGISRNDMLKALGNGVVPAQCAEATRRFLADVAAGRAGGCGTCRMSLPAHIVATTVWPCHHCRSRLILGDYPDSPGHAQELLDDWTERHRHGTESEAP